MKCLVRNKTQFYFSNYRGKKELEDENGNKTGEYNLVYTSPIACLGNVSPAKGTSEIEPFGNDVNYSRVIVMDKDVGIEENAIVWLDVSPFVGDYDYVVKRVAKSLNNIKVAVSKVDVDG